MSTLSPVTDATFDSEVLKSSEPVLVDFWAEWCAPCRQLTPIIEELASAYEGQVKFVSVDADANTGVAAKQDIRTLPTVQLYSGGELRDVIVGSVTKMKLRKALDDLI